LSCCHEFPGAPDALERAVPDLASEIKRKLNSGHAPSILARRSEVDGKDWEVRTDRSAGGDDLLPAGRLTFTHWLRPAHAPQGAHASTRVHFQQPARRLRNPCPRFCLLYGVLCSFSAEQFIHQTPFSLRIHPKRFAI
jgi:hypothetical protein